MAAAAELGMLLGALINEWHCDLGSVHTCDGPQHALGTASIAAACNLNLNLNPHILECDLFNTTISFMDLGPKWKSLQSYLDQTSASRLSGADAITQSLGLHLPFSTFSASLPMLPTDLPVGVLMT